MRAITAPAAAVTDITATFTTPVVLPLRPAIGLFFFFWFSGFQAAEAIAITLFRGGGNDR